MSRQINKIKIITDRKEYVLPQQESVNKWKKYEEAKTHVCNSILVCEYATIYIIMESMCVCVSVRLCITEGRRPLTEDTIWRRTTFNGRQPLTEDDLWQKTIFEGKRPLTEDNLWWKTTFDERQPLTEDNLWRKTNFDERRLLTEDDL